MKPLDLLSTGLVLLLLGAVVPTYAQQPDRGAKPSKPEQQPKPGKQQPQARGPQERRQQQPDRPSQQGRRVRQGEQRGMWQQYRARSWQSDHRTWQQRGGYSGYRIPPARFRGRFGRQHGFRIYRLPLVIADGYPRFQFGGYWFGIVDPWPEYWSDNWYQRDYVYIDYSDDGYYLYNRSHPDVRIAIQVFLH